jgi:hypothetical protein
VKTRAGLKGEPLEAATLQCLVGKTYWTLSHNIYPSDYHYLSFSFLEEQMAKEYQRIWLIAASTFMVTFLISGTTREFLGTISPFFSFLVLITVILIGILFDIIGTAVITAHESTFHAMAAKQVFGATHAIRLIKSAGEVASFCNDLVGDIAGTLSGAMGAIVAASLGKPVLIVIMAPTVSTVTVVGKALGKRPAIKHADRIIYQVSCVLAWWDKIFHGGKKHQRS